jgi:hypothetical protein
MRARAPCKGGSMNSQRSISSAIGTRERNMRKREVVVRDRLKSGKEREGDSVCDTATTHSSLQSLPPPVLSAPLISQPDACAQPTLDANTNEPQVLAMRAILLRSRRRLYSRSGDGRSVRQSLPRQHPQHLHPPRCPLPALPIQELHRPRAMHQPMHQPMHRGP